jgi:hypothetical protein
MNSCRDLSAALTCCVAFKASPESNSQKRIHGGEHFFNSLANCIALALKGCDFVLGIAGSG